MKCEICPQANAETAIVRGEGETAEELYVCKACAKAERQRRQKKSQRTRKVTGLPPGELFDLLSPLRLAAMQKLLDGITLEEIEKMLLECDLTGAEDKLEQEERDQADADRADEMNRRFEDVMLNERAEEKFL